MTAIEVKMALDVVALVISGISLLVSLFFTVWNTHPHIKIKVESGVYTQQLNLLAVIVSISNSSQIGGTISDAYVKIGGKKYPCLYIGEDYDLSSLKVQTTINKNSFSLSDEHFRLPMSIGPFSFSFCAFVFPNVFSTKPIDSFYFYTKHVGRLRPIRHFICATSADKNPEANKDIGE